MQELDKKDLPPGFDWSFYLTYHPDLIEAGLRTEENAISHYLLYGKSEGRLFSPEQNEVIPLFITNNQQVLYNKSESSKEIVLFIQWYLCDDSEIYQNHIQCLENNLQNIFINKICIFLENTKVKLPEHLSGHPKIQTLVLNKRLTYKDWFYQSVKMYPESIKILANNDIYFDETLELVLKQYFSNKTFYAITRKDIDTKGEIVESHDTYQDFSRPTNPNYSHDCWIFNQPLEGDLDFKLLDLYLGVGNCDRLLKKHIEESGIHFINLYPDVNAIHLDKRQSRSRSIQEYPLVRDSIDYKKINIQNFLTPPIIKYKNQLESICLLLTGKELINGVYDTFINKLIKSLTDNNLRYSKSLDFNIATQHTIPSKYIDLLNQYFNNINIINLSIPNNYNKYKLDDYCDIYGSLAGPNWCFFQAINNLQQYNTSLFLECDVFFGQDWLHKIYNYCLFSGGFWISGSKNYTSNTAPLSSISNQHLNGGVCLYATGNKQLQSFINFCNINFPLYVKYKGSLLPYDYILYYVINDFFNFDLQNKSIWQLIALNYVSNNLIYNYSTEQSSNKCPLKLDVLHDYAILHKK